MFWQVIGSAVGLALEVLAVAGVFVLLSIALSGFRN